MKEILSNKITTTDRVRAAFLEQGIWVHVTDAKRMQHILLT